MDWNDDGLEDIIAGDRNGFLNYFRRTGTGIHDLTSEGKLLAGGTTIDVGANSAPVCVYVHHDGTRERLDWDEDGLCDMLVGTEGTYPNGSPLRLFLNEGTNAAPVFSGYEALSLASAGYRAMPQVVDLNGDDKKDVLVGNYEGYILYYENTGTNADPAFGAGEKLQAGGVDLDLGSGGTRFWVDDWNSDGFLDILASDYDGYVHKFLGEDPTGVEDYQFAAVDVSEFAVSPAVNPGSSFSFRLTGLAGTAQITVFDASGRSVLSTDASDELVTIGAENLPAGVYTAVARQGSAVSSCRMVLTE